MGRVGVLGHIKIYFLVCGMTSRFVTARRPNIKYVAEAHKHNEDTHVTV